jgi:hypothetical protein
MLAISPQQLRRASFEFMMKEAVIAEMKTAHTDQFTGLQAL